MATREHLVVVLPGIGGSVLEHPDGRTAWDAGFGGILGLGRDPDRLSLAEAPDLRPTGLIRSRRLLPGWTVIHGYDGLIDRLGELPGAKVAPGRTDDPVPDANIVLFPYDFRRSIVDAATLLAGDVHKRLERFGGQPANRVIVVAHSMGGLVARYWLGPLEGWRVCRALITLGTPHRGAPKALHWLVNGPLGGLLPEVTAVLREWPSVAELLPRYPAVWDTVARTARYPHELPIDWLASMATSAYAVHEEIERAWRQVPRDGTQVDPRVGWSHRTPSAARWDGARLAVTKKAPTWLPLGRWTDDHGDGTVPAFSAVPIEMGGHDPVDMRVRERHSPLGSAEFVTGLVEDYESYPDTGPIRGAELPAAIGLDLDEEHLAGEPVPLQATIEGTDDEPPAAVWAALRPAGRVTVLQELSLARVDGVFHGTFAPPEPGLYDVVVTAPDVAGARLSVLESIAVVGG
jgi:Lecithin:cholesterol acyltransferase